jgi:hypothetical protein
MQKKKPSFQAIPNYSVSSLTNRNESKEVPAEQGWNGAGLRGFSGSSTPFLQLTASPPAIAGFVHKTPIAMMAPTATALAVISLGLIPALSRPLQLAGNARMCRWCAAIDAVADNPGYRVH